MDEPEGTTPPARQLADHRLADHQLAARRLADRIREVFGEGPLPAHPGGWHHMGAVICDASFQARRRYASVVRPRVVRLQELWPDAVTVTGFLTRLEREDLAVAMDFASPRRAATAHALARLLAAHGADTRQDLRAWIEEPAHRAALRGVRGVGPKTADYLGGLVGRPGVAVDVHLRAFAADAGLTDLRYGPLRAAYEGAAVLLGQDPGALEHAVWRSRAA